jgi:hypothetical protein
MFCHSALGGMAGPQEARRRRIEQPKIDTSEESNGQPKAHGVEIRLSPLNEHSSGMPRAVLPDNLPQEQECDARGPPWPRPGWCYPTGRCPSDLQSTVDCNKTSSTSSSLQFVKTTVQKGSSWRAGILSHGNTDTETYRHTS